MYKGNVIALGGLIGLTLMAGVGLSSSSVFADDSVVDNIAITVPVSCTLSGTNLIHNVSMTAGQYKNDIGSANIKALCNDASGFAVYAIGYSGDTNGNDKMLGSGSLNIPTGKYSAGATNSSWSMKLTPVSGVYAPTIRNDESYNYTDFEIIPSDYTKVAYRTSGTDVGDTAVGANFNTHYAIYVSNTQPAGSYTGKVKFTLVHPSDAEPGLEPVACTAGKICYQPNGSAVIGEMGEQDASNNTDVTLWAANFKRDGYGFAGWNTEFDYSGTYYGPNQDITAPSDVSTNGLSLYAVWVKSAGTLQNWSGCSSLAQGSVTALTDSRDNNTYAVAKLADGKCWMIENLRLDDSAELSSSNTHDPSLPLTNVYNTGSTSNHLSPTSSVSYNVTTAPEGWCSANSSACDDQSRLRTDNTVLFTNNTSANYSASSNVYSYGNYYNWYSATAGHGKYGSGYGNGYNASGDICPAGWHLPRGGNKANEANNEFWSLIVTGINGGVNPANYGSSSQPYYYGTEEADPVSNALRSYPNNFVYPGSLFTSSIINRNSMAYYWSASGSDSSGVYLLYFGGVVYPGTNGNSTKYTGLSVRCLVGS